MAGALFSFIFALCLGLGTAWSVKYPLENQEVGYSDADGKSICLFFGPMDTGFNLSVDLAVIPTRPVVLGISERHECPPSRTIQCGNLTGAKTDAKGVLQFSENCVIEKGAWVILFTEDLSVQSMVTGLITLDHMSTPEEVFTMRDEPLPGGGCLFFGPLGKQSELHVELTTEGLVPLEIRVEEEKLCPPKDYTQCGLDRFSMTEEGLDIHTECDIEEGSWIAVYYANKEANTTVTGMIYFRRLWRDLNSAIVLGGICAAIFLIVLIVVLIVFFCCCKRKRNLRVAKDQFIAHDEVAAL